MCQAIIRFLLKYFLSHFEVDQLCQGSQKTYIYITMIIWYEYNCSEFRMCFMPATKIGKLKGCNLVLLDVHFIV